MRIQERVFIAIYIYQLWGIYTLEMKEQWGKHEKSSTTIWGTDWSYIKIPQGAADKWKSDEKGFI